MESKSLINTFILIDARQAIFLDRDPFKNFLQGFLKGPAEQQERIREAIESFCTTKESLNLSLKTFIQGIASKIDGLNVTLDDESIKCAILKSIQINKDMELFIKEVSCYEKENDILEKCRFFIPYSGTAKREYYEIILQPFETKFPKLVGLVEKGNITKYFESDMASGVHAFLTHRIDQFEGLLKVQQMVYFFATPYNKLKKEKLEQKILHMPSISSLNQLPSILSFMKEKTEATKESFVLKVGYTFQPKKLQDFCRNQIMYSKYPVQMVPVDLRYDFAYEIHVLFHKISDLPKYFPNPEDVDTRTNLFMKMYQQHGKTIAFVDPPDNIDVYKSRVTFQKVFETLFYSEEFKTQADDLFKKNSLAPIQLFVPKISIIKAGTPLSKLAELIKMEGLRFPFILKTVVACNSKESHTMAVALNIKGLEQILQHKVFSSQDFILQELIKHNERIFKVYVIENYPLINSRPSIPNLDEDLVGGNAFIFDSQQPFKEQLEFLKKRQNFVPEEFSLNESFVALIVRTITAKLKFTMYGIDIAKEVGTGNYYLVDCNYLPGYKNLNDLQKAFHDHFSNMYQKVKGQQECLN